MAPHARALVAASLAAALPAAAGQTNYWAVPPLTYYDLSPLGYVGNSGINACFLNYFLGSDTTIAPNNGVWGAPKNPAGVPQCPTTAAAGFTNGTCTGASGCAAWNIAANVTGYFPNTPAPCWSNTAPTSYNITPGALTWNGYSVADVTGTTSVPHFLDFGSVLAKDVNGEVHRVGIPAGACLPGNLVNVRTSAVSFTAANPSVTPLYPAAKDVPFPTGANQIYTTSNDVADGTGLQAYEPASGNPAPTPVNGGAPPTIGTIRVYFALNFGLRNALDNACDGRNKASTAACVNGGYYVSNLTTALLGDASKGLGRATYALIKLCHSPVSTIDRPWRKRAGDAINNKQCLDVRQVMFGSTTEGAVVINGSTAVPNANSVIAGNLWVKPVNAQYGIAVNDKPLYNFTDGNVNATTGVPTPVIAQYTNTITGAPTPSPVAFCRPLPDPTSPNGVNPSKAAGWTYNSSDPLNSYLTVGGKSVPNGTTYDNCVTSGSSWAVTKGTNVNLNDPAWYTVDVTFLTDTPSGNYFVRVFALDANGNYLGFGSSAGSANLTNTAQQNYFHVNAWPAWRSAGTLGTQVRDIQSGAIGCSILSVVCGAFWVGYEVRLRRKAASQEAATEVFHEAAAAAKAEDAAAAPADVTAA